MRKLPIPLLRPGMKVARPVYNSDGHILINTGIRLTSKYISRMRQIGIPAVYIEDYLLDDVEVDDILADETRMQARKTIKRIHMEASEAIARGNMPKIAIRTVTETVDRILNEILSKKDLVVNLADIRAFDDYTFAHSVNVCTLSLLTGISLGYNRRRLFSLGTGALLHDIGKVKVPAEILNKPGRLTEQEFQEVQKHSIYGFEILRQQDIGVAAAHVAYEHHERYNGEGYPRQLKGDAIHEFAQITGMVDVFDALVSDRIYRKGHLPHEAFELITASGNYLFNYRIVKAFVENVAAYPVGTIVELSSGEMGVVVGTPKGYPHRPNVRTFTLEGGIPRPVREVRLSEETLLIIRRVIPEEEFMNARGDIEKVVEM